MSRQLHLNAFLMPVGHHDAVIGDKEQTSDGAVASYAEAGSLRGLGRPENRYDTADLLAAAR